MSIRNAFKPWRPTRRRALTILAGGIGIGLTGFVGAPEKRHAFTWRGTALGADARITLVHHDKKLAQEAVAACIQEIERLENQFSLYRSGSALCQLNRDAFLPAPSLDMLDLLSTSVRLSALTSGAFDPSVQPLWRLLARHNGQTPPIEAYEKAMELVDCRRIEVSAERISLGVGQELTLNGIAQGYITDRVADLLKTRGWQDVLIGLGELRASGARADGKPWRVGIKNGPELSLDKGGIAVSESAGLIFGPNSPHNHLISPADGTSPPVGSIIAVRAPSAAIADGLSTALSFVPIEGWRELLQQAPADQAWQIEVGDPSQITTFTSQVQT